MRSPIRWPSKALYAPAENPEKRVKGSEFCAPVEDLFLTKDALSCRPAIGMRKIGVRSIRLIASREAAPAHDHDRKW
jgi:hypothetical protein